MGRADIKLGYSCNNECIHCVISDFRDKVLCEGRPEDITAEEFKRELDDSRRRTDWVVFTGGEPTIRKELLDLVAYAHDIGFKITMQTNGRKLSDMKFARALCSIAPINFCIALHGPDAKIHDSITQRKNSFNETIQGIRNVIEIRKTSSFLSGKIVLSKINGPYIAQTVRLMISLGFSSISLTFPHACGNARKQFFRVVPKYSQIALPVLNAIELCVQNGVSVNTETIPFCFLPGQEDKVSELRMAREDYVELKQYGYDEKVVDWGSRRLEIKSKFPQCKQCRFDHVCEGPWCEYPDGYGSDEFIPVEGGKITDVQDVLHQSFTKPAPGREVFRYQIDNCFSIKYRVG